MLKYPFKFVVGIDDKNWRCYGFDLTVSEEWRDIIVVHAQAAIQIYKPEPGNYLIEALLGSNGFPHYVFHVIEDPDLPQL